VRNGIVFSSVLHVALVVLLVYGFPDSARELSFGGTPVPVIFENPFQESVTAAVTPRSEPAAPTEAPPDAIPSEENTTEPPPLVVAEARDVPAQTAAPSEALSDPAAAPAPETALSEMPESPQTTAESPEPPELPEGPLAEAMLSQVTRKVAVPHDAPVEEVAPEPLVAPEASLTLTEKAEPVPPREAPAPRVASEAAPPVPVLQSAPSPLHDTGTQAPPTPITAETPEQQRQPEAEAAPAPEEPVAQAPSITRPGPEVPTPEEIPTPPALQEAPAPKPALAVPHNKPVRNVSLPKAEPPKQQQAERKPEPESKPQQNADSPSGADDLIASLAGGGASQREPAPSGGSVGKLSRVEEDRVRKAVSRNWNVDCGALGIRDMVVEIRFQIEPDRTVSDSKVLDTRRYHSDPVFRSAADAAVRAVRQIGPLPLPPDGYDQWNRLKLTFYPDEVCR